MAKVTKNHDGTYTVSELTEIDADLVSRIFEKLSSSEREDLLRDLHRRQSARRSLSSEFSTLAIGRAVEDDLGQAFEIKRVQRKADGMPANLVELTNASGATFVVQEERFSDYFVC
ncbi:MAG: hypothetical protein IPK13_20230 [Deltaproteobacteria bacterium]|nr:hypothetical protein [Deltaproteobacteria bacterium]